MAETQEKPPLKLLNCVYSKQPGLIEPSGPTPNHILPLSNLDDQTFLRFSIKYLFLFERGVNVDLLKSSLSKVLVEYYPLAGRLRKCPEDDQKLQVDCNGEGALFAEALLDMNSEDFLALSRKPNGCFRSLLYKVEALDFIDIPPLVVQVTHLRCGGMILCTAINHCLCDGIGTSQFLHAWAHITSESKLSSPLITPFHSRHVLWRQTPTKVRYAHPQYTKIPRNNWHVDITKFLQSQTLITTSLIFTNSHILHLKRQCVQTLNCTTFEALASHTWRSWIRSLDLPHSLHVKLLFPVNIRKKINPEMPQGYYGNSFILGCAEAFVYDLVASDNLDDIVSLVQKAKSIVDDNYVESMIALLEEKNLQVDMSSSLVISEWSKLGLQNLDFGSGKPLQVGPLASNVFCLFLPVIDNSKAVRVLMSLPENSAGKFEYYMTK